MNKSMMTALATLGLGIVIGVLFITNFDTEMLSRLFAGNKLKIGADQQPVVMNDKANILNEAMTMASSSVLPTVVSINVVVEEARTQDKYFDEWRRFFEFFGDEMPNDGNHEGSKRKSQGAGSGVIITPDGYIITNNHVVENSTEIKVITSDKKEYKAELIGTDPLTDLAVIKINAANLQAAHFAQIGDVKVGEFVIAVGNPMGLNSTVTNGIVSAIGRGDLMLGGNSRSPYQVENFIQTDAAINPGNSGGGLFNLNGSLIGINTAIATRTGTYIGYGFAIPIDLVESVASDIIDDGKVDRGYIGVQIKTIDEIIAKSAGLDKVEGVLVHDVLPDSPAEKAGVEPGDIILELDDKPISTSNELQSRVAMARAGTKVKLTIWRNEKKISKTVSLESKNKSDFADDKASKPEKESYDDNQKNLKFGDLGFSVESLTSSQKEKFGVKEGVFISQVERYSPSSERGLFPNGVITKADRQKVKGIGQLKEIINSKKPGDAILLQVKYEDSNRIIAMEIPKNVN